MAIPHFTFKGVSSLAMGVVPADYPPVTRPAERVTSQTVPGRSGELTMTESPFPVYDAYTKTMDCYLKPGADPAAAFAWLTGRGDLIFGNEPARRYEARTAAPVELGLVTDGDGYLEFTLVFIVQPLKFLHPAVPDIVMNASSALIKNPGNAVALPRITVSGAGAGTVTVNGVVVSVSNLANGVALDWLAMEITTPAGTANRASYVTGGPQWFNPGDNTVTKSAAVTSCVIQPNWCFL